MLGTLRIYVIGVVIVALPAATAARETEQTETAERALRDGDHAAAERAYDAILALDPGDLEARVQRGTVRSWQGRHIEARQDFRAVLAVDPNHLASLVGLGYDFSWDRAYSEATATFRRALAVAPDNRSARMGLAYTFLWSGRTALALRAFTDARHAQPEDPEAAVGVGQAQLALRHHRRARAAFLDALAIDPNRLDATEGLSAVQDLAAPLELNFSLGNTTSGGKSGLRQMELATWVHPTMRLSARYDNSLGLDNPSLARTGQPSEAFLGGVLGNWGGSVLTRIEVGHRTLPEGLTQTLFLPEVTFLRHGFFVKAGGVVAPSNQDFTDRTGYLGFGFPLSKRCRLEPTAFFSESGVAADREWRSQVYGECRSARGWTFGLGGGGGNIDAAFDEASGRLWTGLVHLSIPIGGYHRFFVSVRYEDSLLNAYTVSMVGFTLRLPRD